MENKLMVCVWIIAILISFVPMSLNYKIIGIGISIVLIAAYIYLAHKNNRLSKTSLIINLVVIGWDLAVVYGLVASR